MLLAEPFSHMAAVLRAPTRGELARLQRVLGITTVYVTHDQLEALAMSDRIAVMNLGVVQQYGTPGELYSHPANMFVAKFIGEPPMNFIPCILERGGSGRARLYTSGRGFDIELGGELAARIDPEFRGGEVVFGIRPIDFEIAAGAAKTAVKAGVLNYEAGCEHSFMEVKVCEYTVLVECSPTVRFNEGDTVALEVASKRFHLFDRKSEASIMKVEAR